MGFNCIVGMLAKTPSLVSLVRFTETQNVVSFVP